MKLRRSVVLAAAAWCLVPATAKTQAPEARVTLEEIGVRASYGVRLRNTVQWAGLTGALDAAFVGGRIAVLNAQAPWIRIYDETDSLVATAIPNGDGLGQSRKAYSLSSTPTGHVLVAHRQGIVRIDADGRIVGSLPGNWPVSQAIGAVEACGGDPVYMLDGWPDFAEVPIGVVLNHTAALVRMRLADEVLDTLAVFPATRTETRIYHPWLVDVSDGGLLFYSEEADVDRLTEVTCEGDIVHQTPIDSVSSPRMMRLAEDRSVITVPRPPFASGLVRLDETVLWASREVHAGDDSVTVITTLQEGEPTRRLEIEGWYKLFDVGPDSSILVGNAWALGMNWEWPVSWRGPAAVLRIDGENLLRLIDERGVPVSP